MKIVTDILRESLNPASKTRIMYRANLNFLRFRKYLSELLENGLIDEENIFDNGVVYYRTTDKGRDLLKVLKKAEELLST
jgi:predicted transcriptional regulator